LYCATHSCLCSAGLELLEFDPLLLDGLDEPELLLLLFEGFEEGLELLELGLFLFEFEFEVEAVLFFFDSEEFDLLEVSAFAVSSFFSSCFTSDSSFFSYSVFAESSDGVKVTVLPSFFVTSRLTLSSFKETSTFLVSAGSTSLNTNVLS